MTSNLQSHMTSNLNNGNQPAFPYHAYIGDNLPQSSWMHVAGSQYGYYFPHPQHSQPQSFITPHF